MTKLLRISYDEKDSQFIIDDIKDALTPEYLGINIQVQEVRVMSEEEIEKFLYIWNNDNRRDCFSSPSKMTFKYPIPFKKDIKKLSQALSQNLLKEVK